MSFFQDPPKLLHLGCGQIAPDGWVNLDGSWNARLGTKPGLRRALAAVRLMPRDAAGESWPAGILVRDLRRPLPFPDGAGETGFDATFSSHLIEHMHRVEALRLLREAARVLRPGGRCRTLVPDLAHSVGQYLEQRALPPAVRAEGWADPARGLNRSLGLRRERPLGGSNPAARLYHTLNDFRTHKQMYDEESLIALMVEAGFEHCERRVTHETDIPLIDRVELPRRTEHGLIVEGRKPA